MTIVSTLDIPGLTPDEYRRIVDHIKVETNPAKGIYLHLAARIEGGYRITEVWSSRDGFDAFIQDMLYPAAQALGIQREVSITVEELHNIFAPRFSELPGLAHDAPGGPGR